MMHKTWSGIEEVLYCFSRSSVRFQGHWGQKEFTNFDLNLVFLVCNSSLNTPMATKWCTKLKVAQKRCLTVFKVICQISRSHWKKNDNFDLNWAFLDSNSCLNSLLAFKWSTKLEAVQKKCRVVFQCNLVNFKVTLAENWMVWLRFEHFQMITSIWIHGWQWTGTHKF